MSHRIIAGMLLVAVFVLEIVTDASGQDRKTRSIDDARFQALDVFELEFATDPQISPDGSQVVYLRNSFDIRKDRRRSQLWLVDAAVGAQSPLEAPGGSSPAQPRWSPDGKRLAWVASSVEGGSQLFCRWIASGETSKLTNLPDGPGNLTWSPDGTLLAFTMRVAEAPAPFAKLPSKPAGAEWAEPFKVIRKLVYRHDGGGYAKDGYSQVFVVPSEGGTPRQLTAGEFDHEGPLAWSPDSASLLFVSNRRPDWEYDPLNSELYEVTLANRAVRAITDRKGMDAHPVISPDGRRIAYVGYDDQRLGSHLTKLYVMDRDGGNRRCLTESLDRSAASPVWNKTGDGLFFQYDDSGNTWLAFVSLDGRCINVANNLGGATIGRPYSSGSFSLSKNDIAAYTHGLTSRPADVAVIDGRDAATELPSRDEATNFRAKKKNLQPKQNPKQKTAKKRAAAPANITPPPAIASAIRAQPRLLTKLNADLLAHKELGKVESFWYRSSAGGLANQAWVITPPGFDPAKKYPLVLEIHGGPYANYGDRFSAEMQLYAAAGYVVLYCNPRGSTGYGAAFANHIHHNYPSQDYDDLMSGVDEVLRRGYVDEQRLYVTGGSGGGVLTAWIVGKTNRFQAAVSAKPVINWYSFALTSDAYPFFNQYWFPGFPWEHPEHYLKRSPLSLVGNVSTPTMLLTGEQDFRTPMSESEQFYQALKLRKIDTALVRVPGASHDIAARPSHLISQVAHTLRWFETHQGGGAP